MLFPALLKISFMVQLTLFKISIQKSKTHRWELGSSISVLVFQRCPNQHLLSSWDENNCFYKLSNWQNDNYFYSKWQLQPFWLKYTWAQNVCPGWLAYELKCLCCRGQIWVREDCHSHQLFNIWYLWYEELVIWIWSCNLYWL